MPPQINRARPDVQSDTQAPSLPVGNQIRTNCFIKSMRDIRGPSVSDWPSVGTSLDSSNLPVSGEGCNRKTMTGAETSKTKGVMWRMPYLIWEGERWIKLVHLSKVLG